MAKPIHGLFVAILLAAAGIAGPAWAAAPIAPARAFIVELGDEAMRVAKPSVPPTERQAKIADLLRRGFDFDTISRLVLGRYWNQATPAQQDAYRHAFTDFVIETYARRLSTGSVSGFSVTGARAVDDRDVIIDTAIEPSSGPAVNYGWRVRAGSAGQKIVDVVVEGVSMIVTQRADFASVVQRQGIDGLIDLLKRKQPQS